MRLILLERRAGRRRVMRSPNLVNTPRQFVGVIFVDDKIRRQLGVTRGVVVLTEPVRCSPVSVRKKNLRPARLQLADRQTETLRRRQKINRRSSVDLSDLVP